MNLIPIQIAIVVIFLFLFSIDFRPYLPTSYECEMSYMYGRPYFHQIILPNEFKLKYPKYNLYLYTEDKMNAGPIHELGFPVLFIHGNRGSYLQVRSLATHTMRLLLQQNKDANSGNRIMKYSFFTLEMNELSALYGGNLFSQTKFTIDTILHLKNVVYKDSKFGSRVILVGHSMGGIVSRGVLIFSNMTQQDIPLIITLATPHLGPPVLFDHITEAFYEKVHSVWSSNEYIKPVLISIGGGWSDYQIASELAQLEATLIGESMTLVTTSIPNVWVNAEHLEIVWCKELQVLIAKSLYNIYGTIINNNPKTYESRNKEGKNIKNTLEQNLKYGLEKNNKRKSQNFECKNWQKKLENSIMFQAGSTCFRQSALTANFSLHILIVYDRNTNLYTCNDKQLKNCTLYSLTHTTLLPNMDSRIKLYRIFTLFSVPIFIIEAKTITKIVYRGVKSEFTFDERLILPAPFPWGLNNLMAAVNTNSLYSRIELQTLWPMHLAFQMRISTPKCDIKNTIVIENSNEISDTQIHHRTKSKSLEFWIRPQRIIFTPGQFELEIVQTGDPCEVKLEVEASWWVTVLNFAIIHLSLIPTWVLLAIFIQWSFEIFGTEHLSLLLFGLVIMFYQYGFDSLALLLFYIAIFSGFGLITKLLQTANLKIALHLRKKNWNFQKFLFPFLILFISFVGYFCSGLGLILLYFLTLLRYINRPKFNANLLSWSTVLLFWVIGMSVPSIAVWLKKYVETGRARLNPDPYLYQLLIGVSGIIYRFYNNTTSYWIIPLSALTTSMIYSVIPILLYSYCMYAIYSIASWHSMLAMCVFTVIQTAV